MPRRAAGRRAGFTLVELLVVVTVAAILTAIAVAVIPGAMDQDRTTDAAATIRQHLMIAKAKATREKDGRGIRFVLGPAARDYALLTKTPKTPNPPEPDPSVYYCTELQYIEAAPTIVPNPLGLTRQPDATTKTPGDPYVEFDVTNGTLENRCRFFNVNATDEVITVMQNDLGANWFPKLYCPELGPDSFGRTQRFEVHRLIQDTTTNKTTWQLVLDRDPHTLLGAGTTQRSYRFAIEPRSRPILGEPNVQLPKNVCVDLAPGVSFPGARSVTLPAPSPPAPTPPPITLVNYPIDFEIMFAPNGQVTDPTSSGSIYLWVRDFTKTPDLRPLTVTPAYTYSAGPVQFQQGGEMQLVALKAKTGSLGVSPVLWPSPAGTYGTGQGPYSLAVKDANNQ